MTSCIRQITGWVGHEAKHWRSCRSISHWTGTDALSNPSGIKLLRDELARAIAGVQKGARVIEEMDARLRQFSERLPGRGMRLSYHGNLHSPP